MNNNKVITRFAPSPTGLLHLGSYRTAIFSYFYARKNNGEFILRIEDTDKQRSKKEYEDNILDSLKWLGITYDNLYRQSENADRHRQVLQKMINDGKAYISKEEAKDGSGVIKDIIRFKNPNTVVTFEDQIKGTISVDTTDLGDFVIAKNLSEPLFHLAVVVDDFDESVTHIIRGDDHVSNTPRQILIQRAIGAPTPVYAHIPLVLGEDKQKLSKRKGALPVSSYKEKGFLPEAILNGIAFIGWNPGTEQEIFSPEELIKAFDLSQVQKSSAVFNEVKLRWFNKEHIRKMTRDEQKKAIMDFIPEKLKMDPEKLDLILPIILERIETFADVKTMSENGEFDFVFEKPNFPKEMLICSEKMRKGVPLSFEDVTEHLKNIIAKIETLGGEEFTAENVKNAVWDYASEKGRGIVLWAMRVALSGREKSPDPFQISGIIGKEETILRLTNAANQ